MFENMSNMPLSQYFLDNLVLPNNENQLIESVNNQIAIYLTYSSFYGMDYGYQEFLKKQNLNNFSEHTNAFYQDAIKALARDFIEKANISLENFDKTGVSVESLFYEIYCAYNKHCFHQLLLT